LIERDFGRVRDPASSDRMPGLWPGIRVFDSNADLIRRSRSFALRYAKPISKIRS
jgi:hypothetical protein